jgi:hypothetical protein
MMLAVISDYDGEEANRVIVILSSASQKPATSIFEVC